MTPDGLTPAVYWNFEEAARVVRERTRLDREQAVTDDVRRLLEAIETEMFESAFQVASPRPSRATFSWFKKVKRTTPFTYLVVRRIEVALFLLDHTDAEVPTIARLVGYAAARSFSAAFKRMMGYSPSEERRRWRAGLVEVAPPSAPGPMATRIVLEPGDYRREVAPTLRRVVAGALPRRTAAGFLAELRASGGGRRIAEWVYNHLDEELDAAPALPVRAASPPAVDDQIAHFEAAVRSTLDVLGRFDADLPKRLAPVLERLRAKLVEPGFTVAGLKNELLVDDIDLSWFTRTVGAPSWQYVLEGRMEVTARLLSDSPLSVPSVALLVDYSDPQQFRRTFKRWSGGLTPSEYRARMRIAAERAGEVPAEYVHWRFLEGLPLASREERMAWVGYLEKVYGLEPDTTVVG